jgi:15-cis-phytoene desaturase
VAASVGVVGGGLAGLSAAVALASAGYRVTLFERERALGGRARSWYDEMTGDAVDTGPHILLSAYRNMLDLLRKLGTASRVRWQHDRFITFVEGRREIVLRSRHLPAPLPFLPGILDAPSASLRDKLSMMPIVLAALRTTESDLRRLDDEDGEAWLRSRGVRPRAINWHWRSLSLLLLNVPLERCSAAALVRLFRFFVTQNHLAPGLPKVGLSELYVPQARRFIAEHGGAVHTGAAVGALDIEGDTLRGVALDDGSRLAFDYCIAALPPRELQAILPPARLTGLGGDSLARFRGSPYISCYLWFATRLTRRRFWTRPWTAGGLSCEYYDLANIRPDHPERGSLIATNIIYSHHANELSDEAIVAAVQNELAQYLPEARTALMHARVHRIPMAIVCPHPRTEFLRPGTLTSVRGLFLAGDWTATSLPSSMESAVRSGRLAAEAVSSAAGAPRRFALPPPHARGLARWLRREDVFSPPAPPMLEVAGADIERHDTEQSEGD